MALSDWIVITIVAVGVLSASTDSRDDGGGVPSDSDSVVDAGLSSALLDSGVNGGCFTDSTDSGGASVPDFSVSFFSMIFPLAYNWISVLAIDTNNL